MRLSAERKNFALSLVLLFLTCETQAPSEFQKAFGDFGGLSRHLKNGDVFLMAAFER